MIIAPYREDELEAVAALVNAAYRGETSRAGWTSEVELLGGQRTDPSDVARRPCRRAGSDDPDDARERSRRDHRLGLA